MQGHQLWLWNKNTLPLLFLEEQDPKNTKPFVTSHIYLVPLSSKSRNLLKVKLRRIMQLLKKESVKKLTDLERKMFEWFHQIRLYILPISGPCLKGKLIRLS